MPKQINYKQLYETEHKKNVKLKKTIVELEEQNKLLITENKELAESKKFNIGEKDEIKTIKTLFKLNEKHNYKKLIEIFGQEASEGIKLINFETENPYNDYQEITKTKSQYKSDVGIKMIKTNQIYYASIKSKSGAKCAIINHTHRKANVFQIGKLSGCLPNLDLIIKEYIDKRKSKKCNEDINLIKLESIIDNQNKKSVMEVLRYFIFDGTGKCLSKKSANSILIYNNGDISFKKYITIEDQLKYVESILPCCVMSLRNKAMPKITTDCHKPWIYDNVGQNGSIKSKGCLHIRI